MRRDILTSEQYEAKYVGLQHTYYERQWFRDIAKEHGMSCEVFDGCVPGYMQNKFRFGIIVSREQI